MYMARAGPRHVGRVAIGLRRKPPARAFGLERVTRIELALSAWEAVRSVLSGGLICWFQCLLVPLVDRQAPWLVAR